MASRKSNPKDRANEHPSQTSFGDLLSQFVGTETSSIGISIDNKAARREPPVTAVINLDDGPKTSKRTKSKKTGSAFDDVDLDDDDSVLDAAMSEDDDDELFDTLIGDIFEEDENVGLRNNLVALGRKYNSQMSDEKHAEISEVNRAFVKQETALENLMTELGQGAAALDRDIEMMRMSRTRSYKSLADMIAARVSMSTAKLSTIKEMNAIAKAKFDITSKMKKDAATAGGEEGNGGNATYALQKILSVGRSSFVPDEEEYTRSVEDDSINISPSSGDAYENAAENEVHMAMNIPLAETDGDKFIEHEGSGVEYIVDINSDDDSKEIYAVDKFGHVVDDYPLPSNPEQLNFQINELAGEATDQLQRRYRVRRDGNDVIEHEYAQEVE